MWKYDFTVYKILVSTIILKQWLEEKKKVTISKLLCLQICILFASMD